MSKKVVFLLSHLAPASKEIHKLPWCSETFCRAQRINQKIKPSLCASGERTKAHAIKAADFPNKNRLACATLVKNLHTICAEARKKYLSFSFSYGLILAMFC